MTTQAREQNKRGQQSSVSEKRTASGAQSTCEVVGGYPGIIGTLVDVQSGLACVTIVLPLQDVPAHDPRQTHTHNGPDAEGKLMRE